MNEVPDIPGAKDVSAWFGYWPTFHDAEVLSISLDRANGCVVSIRSFESRIEGFNHQNVLSGLAVNESHG